MCDDQKLEKNPANHKLLVIEDNKDLGKLINIFGAHTENMEIDLYDNPKKIVFPESCPWDAALIDWMLPGIDGLVLGKEIQDKYPELSIIMWSSSLTEIVPLSKEAGFLFLAKPGAIVDLINMLGWGNG